MDLKPSVWNLDPTPIHVGRSVLVFEKTDSTNQRALELSSDPGNDGLVVIADEQTAGRGQYGRVWQAPRRSSVLMSALVFPPAALRRPALLTALAAVAVTELVRDVCRQHAVIKWPNDVYLHGKKICGILIEQRGVGNSLVPLAAVIGIGLNLGQSADDFREADLPLAGSLRSVAGVELEWTDVTLRLIRILDREYGRLIEGETDTLESLWKSGLGLVGRWVSAGLANRTFEGRLLELSFEGLIVETEGGMMSLAPETVRELRAIDSEA